MLRHRVHGHGRQPVRPRARDPAHLRPDAATQMGHLDGRLCLDRRNLRQLRDGAGHRHDCPGRRVCAGLPAAPRRVAVRHSAPAQEDQRRVAVRRREASRGAAARRQGSAPAARDDRRDLRAVRQLRPPVPFVVIPGAVREAVARDGEQIVYVARDRLLEAMRWLKETPGQEFDYLVDVTAVEFRDRERPIEVVYFLRSLQRRADIRIKVELQPTDELAVDSVWSLWHGADWLEREVFDMFGITFKGHPDLRRILMWETYAEGYPLRKSFPLRGRFSRAEQVRQALNANPEAHYSLEELSIAEAGGDLPDDIRERLRLGQRGVVPEPPPSKP